MKEWITLDTLVTNEKTTIRIASVTAVSDTVDTRVAGPNCTVYFDGGYCEVVRHTRGQVLEMMTVAK